MTGMDPLCPFSATRLMCAIMGSNELIISSYAHYKQPLAYLEQNMNNAQCVWKPILHTGRLSAC